MTNHIDDKFQYINMAENVDIQTALKQFKKAKKIYSSNLPQKKLTITLNSQNKIQELICVLSDGINECCIEIHQESKQHESNHKSVRKANYAVVVK